jgi:hypothetical protein
VIREREIMSSSSPCDQNWSTGTWTTDPWVLGPLLSGWCCCGSADDSTPLSIPPNTRLAAAAALARRGPSLCCAPSGTHAMGVQVSTSCQGARRRA